MKVPEPRVPGNLHPLAREVLEGLQGHAEAQAIIIGGGVALQHYLDHRGTRDLDAWWAKDARADSRRLIQAAIDGIARRHGLIASSRSWGETDSFDLARGKEKVFSFQIALRDVELDPPVPSRWPPVLLETFRDNLGAKMNALVQRGAPRDFADVRAICKRGLATAEECWTVWLAKNAGRSVREAKVNVLERILVIEARRPLASIPLESDRQAAEELRDWMKTVFCREAHHGPGA